MKIYAISGLGADARLFDKLKLDYPITHLAWENIHHVNSMADYAKLFLKHIDTEEEFVLMGVSLGSMLCTELAKWCKPNLVILISSAETKHELPKMFRVAGGLELLKILPETLIRASGPLVGKIFGSNAQLRKDYLKNLDIPFAKKAAELISTWDNVNEIKGAKLKIKGKFEEYERNMIVKNAENYIDDLEQYLLEAINTSNTQYVSERGEVERWKGGINKEEFTEQMTENFTKYRKQIEDYKNNKTDDQT